MEKVPSGLGKEPKPLSRREAVKILIMLLTAVLDACVGKPKGTPVAEAIKPTVPEAKKNPMTETAIGVDKIETEIPELIKKAAIELQLERTENKGITQGSGVIIWESEENIIVLTSRHVVYTGYLLKNIGFGSPEIGYYNIPANEVSILADTREGVNLDDKNPLVVLFLPKPANFPPTVGSSLINMAAEAPSVNEKLFVRGFPPQYESGTVFIGDVPHVPPLDETLVMLGITTDFEVLGNSGNIGRKYPFELYVTQSDGNDYWQGGQRCRSV